MITLTPLSIPLVSRCPDTLKMRPDSVSHTKPLFVSRTVMKKVFWLSMLGVAGLVGSVGAQSRTGSKRTTRLYEYVQQYDTLSGEWRDLHARVRLECDSSLTRITLWNHWGDERINPVFRIWTQESPQYDAESERWLLEARMRRAKGSNVRACRVESCTILALEPSMEFLVRTSDKSARYRISRKPIPEEYEY